MDNRNLFRVLIPFVILFVSLACRLTGAPPQTPEPALSVYATAITAGGVHACALLNNGRVKCWGDNSSGQLGDGTYTAQNTPIEVPDLSHVIAISAGGEHTCALTGDGGVICWGKNSSGQLGDGTKKLSPRPVRVSGLKDVISLSAGSEHTCVVTKDGSALCWGKNAFGPVGNGSNTGLILSPAGVTELSGSVIAISAGNEHTCAIENNGNLSCWGRNNYGQLGDNTKKNHSTPANIAGLSSPTKALATSFSTSCAVTDDNNTWCWGWIGSQGYYLAPHKIDGLERDIMAITAGADHICGLTENGAVRCLGENDHGQLGNGTTNAVYTAANVNGLGSVKSVAANFYYTCALVSNGEVFCWGNNSTGQLGNGSNTDSLTPVQVVGLTQ